MDMHADAYFNSYMRVNDTDNPLVKNLHDFRYVCCAHHAPQTCAALRP